MRFDKRILVLGVFTWFGSAWGCLDGPETQAETTWVRSGSLTPLVIGIQGLRSTSNADALDAEWRRGLEHGLRLLGSENLSFEFRLVSLTHGESSSKTCDLRRRFGIWRVRGGRLRALRKIRDQDLDLETIRRSLQGGGQEDLLGTSYWDRPRIDLDRFQEPLIRALREVAGRRRVFLIAHSASSIAAYDVLRENAFQIEHLVTIGSPLGLGPVRTRNSGEQGRLFLSDVSRWTNLADPLDPVALDARLDDDYGHDVNDVLVNTWRPQAFAGDALERLLRSQSSPEHDGVAQAFYGLARKADPWELHDVCGYLQTPQLATSLADFIEG